MWKTRPTARCGSFIQPRAGVGPKQRPRHDVRPGSLEWFVCPPKAFPRESASFGHALGRLIGRISEQLQSFDADLIECPIGEQANCGRRSTSTSANGIQLVVDIGACPFPVDADSSRPKEQARTSVDDCEPCASLRPPFCRLLNPTPRLIHGHVLGHECESWNKSVSACPGYGLGVTPIKKPQGYGVSTEFL